jgi:hypothetical protein
MLAVRIDRLPPEDGKDVPFALLQAMAELPDEALGRCLRQHPDRFVRKLPEPPGAPRAGLDQPAARDRRRHSRRDSKCVTSVSQNPLTTSMKLKATRAAEMLRVSIAECRSTCPRGTFRDRVVARAGRAGCGGLSWRAATKSRGSGVFSGGLRLPGD